MQLSFLTSLLKRETCLYFFIRSLTLGSIDENEISDNEHF